MTLSSIYLSDQRSQILSSLFTHCPHTGHLWAPYTQWDCLPQDFCTYCALYYESSMFMTFSFSPILFYDDYMHHAIAWSSSFASISSCLQPLLSHCKHITFIPKTLPWWLKSLPRLQPSIIALWGFSTFQSLAIFRGCGIWTAINFTITINSTFWKIFMYF